MHEFQELFEPIQIGNVQIKNRIAMAPMLTFGLMNPDGTMAQRALDYYIERARGRVGLIISGAFKVENDIDPLLPGVPLVSPASLASFVELVEALHALGTRLFVQLTAGFGRVSTPFMLRDRPVSASAIPNYWDPEIICRELDAQEVQRIVQAFGRAAALLGEAGVDGIELHGHEGYLFDQFTSAIWNKRSDKYGGDLRTRLAFPIEAMRTIKATLGKDYPVQYRYGARHYMKGEWQAALPGEEYDEAGRNLEESIEMARLLEEAGFDSLHIDAGSYDSWYWPHPPLYMPHGCMLDLSAAVKKAVSIPVIAVGRLEVPEVATQALRNGQADMVAIGRGLLTDEHWVRKVEEDRTQHIRPCIGCHDGCVGRIFTGRPLSCAVNPAVGRERLYALSRTETPRDVMVIGGGIAGLEVARAALERGHRVTVYEKSEALGGHVIAGSVPPFKTETAALLEWYRTELDTLGAEVHLNSPVTPNMVRDATPDVVVVATGSEPIIPNVPGIESGHVMNEIEFLMGQKPVGDCVTIVGGGLVGCEAALWAAQNGKQVTIIEQLDELMSAGIYVPPMNKMMLDLLKFHGVRIITGLTLTGVDAGGVTLMDRAFNSTRVDCDSVIIAVGFRANRTMYDELLGATPNLYLIGDAREPRNIRGAIWDGYEVARGI